MPRAYRLGERATSMAATRERIVDAAIALYTEVGASATTLRAIGDRADVAPGTLRNHFASRGTLDRAMVKRLTSQAPLPTTAIFDGATTPRDRLVRLLDAAAVFYDQAEPIYRMWLREPMRTGPWREAGERYGARWAELVAVAAGPLSGDPEVVAIVTGLLQPGFATAVRGGTRSAGATSQLIADAVSPWLEARASALERGVDPGG